VDRELFGF